MASNIYNITAQAGQCIIDIAIQEYGTADAALWVVADNNLPGLTAPLTPGQTLAIRTAPDVADKAMLQYFRNKGIKVAAGVVNENVPNSNIIINVTGAGVVWDSASNTITINNGSSFNIYINPAMTGQYFKLTLSSLNDGYMVITKMPGYDTLTYGLESGGYVSFTNDCEYLYCVVNYPANPCTCTILIEPGTAL